MPELDLYDELRKLIGQLDEHKIEYALCGGLAMAIHARQDDIKALQAGDTNAES